MTEIGLPTTFPNLPVSVKSSLSIGLPAPGCQMKIIATDGTGKSLDECCTGEILVKSPHTVMIGYLNDPEKTRALIDNDGWVHTGDLGYFDNNGFFFIVDRIKDLMKYKSYQIAPAEIENLVLKHPGIAEVGVTGVPNMVAPELGDLVTAFVVLKQNYKPSKLLADKIKTLVAKSSVPYKHLRGGVKFVKFLPKTGSGKVQRRLLPKMNIMPLSRL